MFEKSLAMHDDVRIGRIFFEFNFQSSMYARILNTKCLVFLGVASFTRRSLGLAGSFIKMADGETSL